MASAILALVSIGLLVSLLPRTSLIARSTGHIVDAVGPVWSEASVEQALDQAPRVISEVRIWAAAGIVRGEALVVAALLQGHDRELVRQVKVKIKPSKILQPYVLRFAPYHPVSDEALILQLWVSNERDNHVMFGTSEPRDDSPGPTINLNPTDQGPLAYEIIWRGDGWRAVLEGSWADILRLAGGVAAAVMAVLLRPSTATALRQAMPKFRAAVMAVVGPIRGSLRRAWNGLGAHRRHTQRPSGSRAFYVFPWLIPGFAILHYLANNLILIRAYEAIMISIVVMAGVTVVYLVFRFSLKSSALAAVFTGFLGIAFFAYGHIYAGKELPDDRYFLGLGLPLVLGVGMSLKGRTEIAHTIGRFLNLGSMVLLALPIYQIVFVLVTQNLQQDRSNAANVASEEVAGLNERISHARKRISPDELRDIYYIILDEYPRSGSLESFDNSLFIDELERRGFYVDPQARSNYASTLWSIPTSLNMNYYHSRDASPGVIEQMFNTSTNHTLGRVLKGLGYKYVHVSSGWFMTQTNANADVIVDFGPSGTMLSGFTEHDPCAIERSLSLQNNFATGLLRTTALIQLDVMVLRIHNVFMCEYDWQHPFRALAWLEFMKDSGDIDRPKFVFAHLVKPHYPFSFDRYGNIAPMGEEWDDGHDPTVSSAFHGQILWLNDRLLEVIDGILDDYDEPPIIVMMSDHGYRYTFQPEGYQHPMATQILAAYLLPDGGAHAIYPFITPVNAFRSVLNYYFDLGFPRVEDRTHGY